MKLSVNQLIMWHGDADDPNSSRAERVVFIDESLSDVAALNVDKQRATPTWYKYKEIKDALESAEANVLDIDHCAPLTLTADDLNLPRYNKIKKVRDNRWEVIAPLVTGENAVKILFPAERAALIEERTKVTFPHGKHGEDITYSRQSIYHFLFLWWRGGQTKNSLLGRYLNSGAFGTSRKQKKTKIGRPSKIAKATGSNTGVVLTSFWLNIICLGALLFYKNQKIRDIQAAYRNTLKLFCPKGKKQNEKGEWEIELPDYTKGEVFSLHQFNYHVQKHIEKHLEEFFRQKFGKRQLNLKFRGLKGNSTRLAPYPGALYQIDATIADLYLVSRLNRTHIIGRPVIVVIIDVFSRMIVGVCVRFEREGWKVISLALKNTTENKPEFCKKYGVEISDADWPVSELGDAIAGDRGPMMGYNADALAEAFNIITSNLPPYRPDWKGIVERIFRLLNVTVIKNLPGALVANRERGDRDVRLDAILDINQFTAIIIKAILYHNNHHYLNSYPMDKELIAADVKPIPRELFLWGRANRSGKPRTKDPEAIRIHLLPSGEATVTSRGIKFKKEYYTCELAEDENWRFRARNKGTWKVKVAYDPRIPEIIYLRPPDGSSSITCHLMDRESIAVGSDWAEVEEYYERKAIQDEIEKVADMQARSNVEINVDDMVKSVVGLAEAAREEAQSESKRFRLSGMNDRRIAEIQLMDEEERQEVLERAGFLNITDGIQDETDSSDDSGEEYVERPRFSNVLSIQERLMGHEEK